MTVNIVHGSETAARMVGKSSPERQRDDFYPTPPSATQALLSVEKFEGKIWEPACGNGAMSEILKSHGYDVFSSDLVNRGYGESPVDFLMEPRGLAPNIITNPPYKMAHDFVEKSLSLTTGKVAMLLRLAFLEGKTRKVLFTSTPLARVHVFSERINFKRDGWDEGKGGGGMIAFAWFVWEHGYAGQPQIGWL